MAERKRLLNIEVDDLTMPEFLSTYASGLVVTPNADHLITLQSDREFWEIYRTAEFVTVDSQIVKFALAFLGLPVRAKLSGSDLFPAFYRHHAQDPSVSIFLLGGREGVARAAAERINAIVGRQMIVGYRSPSMRIAEDADETTDVVSEVNRSGATVLAVGLGAPKQERWIAANRDRMPGVARFLAIGATLDFEAGNLKRAPAAFSSLGLEWLFRLTMEPRRLWRRYLVRDPKFLWLVFLQRFGSYRNPFVQERG